MVYSGGEIILADDECHRFREAFPGHPDRIAIVFKPGLLVECRGEIGGAERLPAVGPNEAGEPLAVHRLDELRQGFPAKEYDESPAIIPLREAGPDRVDLAVQGDLRFMDVRVLLRLLREAILEIGPRVERFLPGKSGGLG